VDRELPTAGAGHSTRHSPRVSVVIPCFNLGAFLDEAVESVLGQTYTDFEVLVVDDGSTDAETMRRLSALATPKVAVIRSANQGLPAARNLGIRHAAGEFVCSLDADDRLTPTCLERGVAVLDAEPELAFVSHWVAAFGHEDFEWKPVRCDLGMLLDRNVLNGAALFRRSMVEKLGGFDESMRDGCEDWEFWIRATEAGYVGAIIPEILYEYRQRPDSMSRAMNDTGAYHRIYGELVEKHPESFERHLLDLLLRREWTFGDVCRRIDALEEELTTRLEPALEERRGELAGARARLAACERQQELERERDALARRAESLEAQVRAAAEEQRRSKLQLNALSRKVESLEAQGMNVRRSWSWRMTSPLRRLYERIGLGPRSHYDR
jgi:glycosyltransferase involved in cell wall biosynthesis